MQAYLVNRRLRKHDLANCLMRDLTPLPAILAETHLDIAG